MPKVHLTTLLVAVVAIFLVVALYHALFGRKAA